MFKKICFYLLFLLNHTSLSASEAAVKSNVLPAMPDRTVNLPPQGQQDPKEIDLTLPIEQRLSQALQRCRMTSEELHARGKAYEFKLYNPTFAGDVLEELEDIIINLKDRRPRYGPHILFYGPKGSGKTTLAERISAQAQIPMVLVHASWFMDRFQGGGAQRVRELIDDAQRVQRLLKEPIIIFVEEIDHIANEEKSDSHGESDRATGAIWTGLDAVEPGKIIFIFTTNKEKPINDRLKDRCRCIEIKAPDKNAREAQYRSHLGDRVPGSTIKMMAEKTEGLGRRDIVRDVERAKEMAYAKNVRARESQSNEDSEESDSDTDDEDADGSVEESVMISSEDLEIALFITQNAKLPDSEMQLKLLNYFLEIEKRRKSFDAGYLFLARKSESLVLGMQSCSREMHERITKRVTKRSQIHGLEELRRMLANQKCDHNAIRNFIECASSVAIEYGRKRVETFDFNVAFGLCFPKAALKSEQRKSLIEYYVRKIKHDVTAYSITKLCKMTDDLNGEQIKIVIEEADRLAILRNAKTIEDKDFLVALVSLPDSPHLDSAKNRRRVIRYLLSTDCRRAHVSRVAKELVANNSEDMSFEQIKKMLFAAHDACERRGGKTVRDKDLYVGFDKASDEKCDLREPRFDNMKIALLTYHLRDKKGWKVRPAFIRLFASKTNTQKVDSDQIKKIVELAEKILSYYKASKHRFLKSGGMSKHEKVLFYAARKYNHIIASGIYWLGEKIVHMFWLHKLDQFLENQGFFKHGIDSCPEDKVD